MGKRRTENLAAQPDELWLGYNDVLVPFTEISALLVYQAAWDRRIIQAFGRVPPDAQAVVLLADGRVFPSRRALEDLQSRWTGWQCTATNPAPPDTVAPDPDTQGI